MVGTDANTQPATHKESFDSCARNCEKPTVRYFPEKSSLLNFVKLSMNSLLKIVVYSEWLVIVFNDINCIYMEGLAGFS